ncbi:MAG TPA: hypothetical protein VFF52_17330, partial [Isosphaeraceae bacterium]|nr:hypothetical protein [Isosphaeraceae bacterium]
MLGSTPISSDQRHLQEPGDRRRAWPRCGLLLLAGFATVGLTAAADPEIIRLRVPAQDVSRWFPPGTELRRLSADEFDALVAAMGREQARRRSDLPPRLISARHRARWDSGMLTGRTELVFAARAAGPSEYLLESWTPTILATSQPTRVLGARDSGQATLWLDPSPREQTLVLEWELRARPGSRGRGFRLGLPGKETTVLELELPKGWVASSERGVRCGPLPAADPARSRWELDGRSGRFDLEVRDPSDQKVSPVGAGAWVSGPTEIDLRRRTGRTRDLVNWTADWQLERDPRHPARLDLELDPGLELIEVQGPAVRGYRVLESGPAPRVRVELVGTAPASSTVRLLAHAQVPPEGAWRIPAVRPLDATWMGGRTSVVLDESHLVRDCRVNAGRLISPSRPEAGPGHRLVFEANAPRSVAELVFVQPRTEVSCTVRGQLVLAAAPARLTCRLDWTRHRGSRPELEIDLSPGWIPEQVQVEGLDDPVAWHSALRSSEATRLRVILPATVLAKRQWTLNLTASATAREGRGPLELPRVRAVGAATVDEAWLAWVDEGTVIQPAQARGLAWIDPGEVPGLLGHAPGPNWREALAWRWIAPKAEARLDRHRIDQQPRVAIRTLARIGPAGHGLVLEGTLRIRSGTAPVDAIPIWVNQPAASLASWHFREDDVELALAPIDGSARSRLGLPESGAAWRLPVALPGLAEKAIQFRATLPWSSPGSVPLLGVPRGALMRGTILVETPTGMSSQARASGLTRLNASVVDPPRTERDPDPESGRGDRASPRNRIVHAFSYADADARLELATEPLSPRPVPGLLREAVLTTSGDAAGRALHHLSLLVQLEPAQSLDLVMPPRSSLVRVRRDGSAVAPIGSDTRLSFPAGGAGQGARSSSIVLDYVTEGAGLADGVLCRPELPAINVPCLSFVWEIVTPPGWQAVDCGPGLIANDRVDPTDWPSGALGLWKPAWDFVLGRSAADEIERFRQLDDRLAPAAADEWTLAEWFGRWDSGPWPVIIDRLALRTAGLGPKTPCLTGRARAESPSRSLTMLQQHGLVLAPFSRVLLITTAAESSRFSRPSQWTEAIDETLAWGCDRTDRFQTLARWRGETSPRSPAVIGDEAGDRIELLPGRSLWRFSAASWPGDDAYVHLIEVRRRILAGWIVVGLLGWAWLTTGRRLSRGRLFVPAAVAVACVWLDRVVPARWSSGTAAGFTGALAILIVELGLRAGPGPRATGQANGSRLRRAGTSIVGAALLLAMAGLLATRAAAQPEAGSPILALFPYERLSDPDRPTDPVILRLSDFTELSHRAVGAIAQPPAAVTASSAVHRVVRRAAHDVLVESQFELTARGSAPWSWRVPVSLARDLEATLDGKDVPIAIAAGATQARIAIAAAGSHVLHLRRRAATTVDESGSEVLRLPVNASPTAQVIVEPPRDGTPQGELTARGRTEIQPDGTLVGRLGPADQVVIRWARPGAPAAPPAAGSVEGLVLWDVTPAGDRIRARWTVLQPQEIATVRIAHDPGLVLRSVHAPGLVDVVAEEQA